MIFETISRRLGTLLVLVLGTREPEVLGPTGGREAEALPMGAEGGKLGVFRGVLVVPTLESLAASVSVAVRAAVLATLVGAANRDSVRLATREAARVEKECESGLFSSSWGLNETRALPRVLWSSVDLAKRAACNARSVLSSLSAPTLGAPPVLDLPLARDDCDAGSCELCSYSCTNRESPRLVPPVDFLLVMLGLRVFPPFPRVVKQ